MTTYTYAQLEQLWIDAGGSATTAPVAAAVAEAESGGNATVTSANPDGGTNVGLWQLDTNGKGSGLTVAQLQSPTTNASAAVSGSKGGADWSAWETYVNGAYKAFLANGVTPSSTGVPAASGSASASTTAATVVPGTCVVPYPVLNLVVTTVGGGCILSKSEARALIGGLCLVAGGLIILPGLIVLVAAGFKATGAAGALAAASAPLGRVPGYGKVLGAV